MFNTRKKCPSTKPPSFPLSYHFVLLYQTFFTKAKIVAKPCLIQVQISVQFTPKGQVKDELVKTTPPLFKRTVSYYYILKLIPYMLWTECVCHPKTHVEILTLNVLVLGGIGR